MLMLCAFWQRQKQPAQNFEIVRYSFVNGFEGSVLSSQDVSEMKQPRIHVFSRNDGTQKSIYRKGENKMSAKQFGSNPLAAGIEEVRGSWGWFLTIGILFILLGAVCVLGN